MIQLPFRLSLLSFTREGSFFRTFLWINLTSSSSSSSASLMNFSSSIAHFGISTDEASILELLISVLFSLHFTLFSLLYLRLSIDFSKVFGDPPYMNYGVLHLGMTFKIVSSLGRSFFIELVAQPRLREWVVSLDQVRFDRNPERESSKLISHSLRSVPVSMPKHEARF